MSVSLLRGYRATIGRTSGKCEVGLETHFACKRRLDLARVGPSATSPGVRYSHQQQGQYKPRERRALQQHLNENLSIEGARRRVERCSRNTCVNVVGCSDRVAEREVSVFPLRIDMFTLDLRRE